MKPFSAAARGIFVDKRVLSDQCQDVRHAFFGTFASGQRQTDPEAARDALRYLCANLSVLAPAVRRLDKALGGSFQQAFKAAGIALRDHGVEATDAASDIVERVVMACTNEMLACRIEAWTAWRLRHLQPVEPSSQAA